MTNFKTENKIIKFDRNSLLYYVDVITTDADNFTQYATFYFDRKGRSFCFEPFAETMEVSDATISGRHYYNRTNIIDGLRRIEPMFDETDAQLHADETAHLITLFDSAITDAIIKGEGDVSYKRMVFEEEVLF